ICAPAPSHSEAKTLRISHRSIGRGGAAFGRNARMAVSIFARRVSESQGRMRTNRDRKSTRLNSSHQIISYAVFCLKKKKYTKRNAPGKGLYFSRAVYQPRLYQY